jgi:hypothetical protein
MTTIDVDALRAQIRNAGYPRGTPEQVAIWREGNAESRANLVIENMEPTPDEDAMFAMMLEEGISPDAMVEVILSLYPRLEAAC